MHSSQLQVNAERVQSKLGTLLLETLTFECIDIESEGDAISRLRSRRPDSNLFFVSRIGMTNWRRRGIKWHGCYIDDDFKEIQTETLCQIFPVCLLLGIADS